MMDALYRLFVNYNHLIEPEYCGCKKCNYAGIYDEFDWDAWRRGEINLPSHNINSIEKI